MADRQPRKRKPPTRFNDFEAVELINDSEADQTDVITNYYCKTCPSNPSIHPDCFEAFH